MKTCVLLTGPCCPPAESTPISQAWKNEGQGSEAGYLPHFCSSTRLPKMSPRQGDVLGSRCCLAMGEKLVSACKCRGRGGMQRSRGHWTHCTLDGLHM